MTALPRADRPRDAEGQGAAPDRRQLLHPQAQESDRVAGTAPALACPLHADVMLLDQHGRALLRRDHARDHPQGKLPQHPRLGRGNLGVPQQMEQEAEDLQVEGGSQGGLREDPACQRRAQERAVVDSINLAASTLGPNRFVAKSPVWSQRCR